MMSESFGLLMLNEHISFDVVPSTEMTDQWLKTQRVIALCGASGISDEDAGRLKEWVRDGGGLLATYDSGLYGKDGELRADGGALREVLGIEMDSQPLEGQADCFYRVNTPHPALGEYRNGATILGDGRLVRVKPRAGATVLAECVNLDTQESRGPAVVHNQFGRGRAIYIAGSLEAHYMSSRVRSIQHVFSSIVRYLGQGAPVPFRISAPEGVYGILRRTSTGDLSLWVCANIGFKDAAIGLMRQSYVPASNVEIHVLVPDDRAVKVVHLVRANRTIPFTISAGYVVATIPTLHIAELVHIAFA